MIIENDYHSEYTFIIINQILKFNPETLITVKIGGKMKIL